VPREGPHAPARRAETAQNERVEGGERRAAERRDRRGERYGKAGWARPLDRPDPAREMPRPAEDPSPEAAATSEAVDPGDRVGPAGRLPGQAVEAFEIVEANVLDFEKEPVDPLELERHLEDQPGEPEPADRRSEELGVPLRGTFEATAVAAQEREGSNVPAEAAGNAVVLAVDVVGDRPAQRHEPRPRAHRKTPHTTARCRPANERVEKIRETDAGFGAQDPSRGVEREETVEPAGLDQETSGVEAGIAVGSAPAEGQDGELATAGQGHFSCFGARRAGDPVAGTVYPAPGKMGLALGKAAHHAAIRHASTAAPIASEARSVSAKSTGSWLIRPCRAKRQTRASQRTRTGKTSHSQPGLL